MSRCKITLLCLCSYSSQMYQLYLIAISCDDFCWFEQLIINYTQWIPPNADQILWTMGICLCHWCWWMIRLTPCSSMLRIIVMYLLFIAGHDAVQKNFSFSVVEAAVPTWQDAIWHFSASTCTALIVLAFESFLMLSNTSKLLCDQLLMILQV